MPRPLTLRNRLGNIKRDLLAPLHLRAALAELRRLLPASPDGQTLWSVTERYQGAGWFRYLRAWQVAAEYIQLVEFVAQLRPRIILEIGTCAGGTLLAWSRIASDHVISIDLPHGIHGGGYPKGKRPLYEKLVADRPGVRSLILQADSQSLATRHRVEAALEGRTIDFLFIDGDHRYEGVARDFELWSPLVTPGGYVGFHDILKQKEGPDCEVDRFWSELQERYETREFIEDPQQGWAGIGVLRVPLANHSAAPA